MPLVLLAVLLAPLSAGAFWPWNKKPAEQKTPVAIESGLSESAQAVADAKYRLFENGFEKKDVEAVIVNRNNFWFTLDELVYLFNKENATAKKPLLKNLTLSSENGALQVSAEFKRIVKGKFSFILKPKTEGARLYAEIDKAKLYGIPVPASWINRPFNRELDSYLNFLYQDERYQGVDININDEMVKLDLRFN